MNERIRRIDESDFQQVSDLFNNRKSVEELKWLYTDPNDIATYNAFVSIDANDTITGVIGYITGTYLYNKNSVVGVIPMNWQIKKNYKGMSGVLLFKKILEYGDFALAIQGSNVAQDLYKLFKYKYISKAHTLSKILNIKGFFIYTKGKGWLNRFGLTSLLLPSLFFNFVKKNSRSNSIKLLPYDGILINNNKSDYFSKILTNEYLNWAMRCPLLKSHAFNIFSNKEHIGSCLLYINEVNSVKVGRFVHLSFLGKDKSLWKNVINECLRFLKNEGCCLVTTLAHNKFCVSGFKSSGFLNIKIGDKPIFIRDTKDILKNIDLETWHLQYSEGDKAYRDF